jgi:hypothetical protein
MLNTYSILCTKPKIYREIKKNILSCSDKYVLHLYFSSYLSVLREQLVYFLSVL